MMMMRTGRIVVSPMVSHLGQRSIASRVDVVLKKDCEGLGELGDVLSVARGHARNHLLPSGLAVLATPENRDAAQSLRPAVDSAVRAQRESVERARRRLARVVVQMKRHRTATIDEMPVLHAPVTVENIAEKLYKQHRIRALASELRIKDAPLLNGLGRFSVSMNVEGTEVPFIVEVRER